MKKDGFNEIALLGGLCCSFSVVEGDFIVRGSLNYNIYESILTSNCHPTVTNLII
jgi:hypothetical protein